MPAASGAQWNPGCDGGFVSIAPVSLIGLGADVIDQLIVLDAGRLFEAVVVALLLAFVPYMLLGGGPFVRLAYWWRGDAPANEISNGRWFAH